MAAGEPDPSPPDGGPWEKEKVRKGRRGQGDNAGRPCNLRPGTARGPGREVQRKRGEKRLKQNRKIKAGDKREAEREKEKRRGKRGKGERGTKSEKTR